MKEHEYKDIVKLLRKITERAIDMKDNGLVNEEDIRPILHYEELVEEMITTCYIG